MDDEFRPEIQQRQSPQLNEFKIAHNSGREKLKQLKVKKSTGPDNIAPILLKAAKNATVPSLVNLCEFSIERGAVYPMWKTARLHQFSKKTMIHTVETTDRFLY